MKISKYIYALLAVAMMPSCAEDEEILVANVNFSGNVAYVGATNVVYEFTSDRELQSVSADVFNIGEYNPEGDWNPVETIELEYDKASGKWIGSSNSYYWGHSLAPNSEYEYRFQIHFKEPVTISLSDIQDEYGMNYSPEDLWYKQDDFKFKTKSFSDKSSGQANVKFGFEVLQDNTPSNAYKIAAWTRDVTRADIREAILNVYDASGRLVQECPLNIWDYNNWSGSSVVAYPVEHIHDCYGTTEFGHSGAATTYTFDIRLWLYDRVNDVEDIQLTITDPSYRFSVSEWPGTSGGR